MRLLYGQSRRSETSTCRAQVYRNLAVAFMHNPVVLVAVAEPPELELRTSGRTSPLKITAGRFLWRRRRRRRGRMRRSKAARGRRGKRLSLSPSSLSPPSPSPKFAAPRQGREGPQKRMAPLRAASSAHTDVGHSAFPNTDGKYHIIGTGILDRPWPK